MEALEDGAVVNMKARLTPQLPDKSRPPRWTNQSMGMDGSGSGTCQSQPDLRKAGK